MSGRVEIIHGDCVEVMRRLKAEGVTVQSVVTDPPYHLTSIVKRFGAPDSAPARSGKTGAYARASRGFMGQTWDGGDVAFRAETWCAAYDLLPPGGHLLAFSGTRTYHRMACAVEDAGFEVRDMVAWLYGSGFPKSHNLKGEWEGWGTALKPALEPIVLARKPLAGTVAETVLAHGTGALHVDACRAEMSQRDQAYARERVGGFNAVRSIGGDGILGGGEIMDRRASYDPSKGRWPANVVHDGSEEVEAAFPAAPGQQRAVGPEHGAKASVNVYGDYGPRETFAPRHDAGSAARFFYAAKADKDDRIESKHPTVKPVALMRWLVRLITPPGGLVLDPFAGTGTTGAACLREGFRAVLIEQSAEYVADIQRRIDRMTGADSPLFSAGEGAAE